MDATDKKPSLSNELRKMAADLRKTAEEQQVTRLTKLAQAASATLALEFLARKIG